MDQSNQIVYAERPFIYTVRQQVEMKLNSTAIGKKQNESFTITWRMVDVNPGEELTFYLDIQGDRIEYDHKILPNSDYTTDNITYEGFTGNYYGMMPISISAFAGDSFLTSETFTVLVNSPPKFEILDYSSSLSVGENFTIRGKAIDEGQVKIEIRTASGYSIYTQDSVTSDYFI
ncbi:hypothetical protein TVAG_032220 [Trichomonas vaginalis G3]|uniref:Uncharacterized protein n=1 Tax=Trichomonas vaginalis (strain ATCC PRA-98 / G3) TaxID=412133 RepID=A2FIF7_TRIV3|nr:hypothetical protein TVAGG3_0853220 [Trichomonas vaginalis G3]EAX95319.1 hypothetical protein TVAG_032220 [Trichomonas vaginalis G3]KAI5500146.1 hypothetical protein TVAGG3_0853220 [Trichomonas vaginalis G3]|eukprot:XP_001308249.1 hypothetical protein [Trichomonas vaginalis G3]